VETTKLLQIENFKMQIAKWKGREASKTLKKAVSLSLCDYQGSGIFPA